MGREKLVQRIQHIGDAQFLHIIDGDREVTPEIAQHLLPVDLARRHLVELFLEVGGEVVFHIAPEEAFEECGHDAALVFRDQALLVDAHVAALTEGLEDRDVGRRAADAELFQLLDERGFGIARRRFGEMLHAADLPDADGVAPRHGGKPARILVLAVVEAFGIDLEEAVELHHRAGGAEGIMLAVLAIRADVGGGAFEFGALHLAGDGALPDQFIKGQLVGIEAAAHARGMARHVGRPDRLMRLLGILGLGGVVAGRGRQIGLAEIFQDGVAGGGNGLRRHVDAVGSHIGDEPHRLAADIHAFIEPLGNLHGAGGGKAELAGGFLL